MLRVQSLIQNVLVCGCLLCFASASSYAATNSFYNYTPDPRKLEQFIHIIPSLEGQASPLIAAVDLNEDGIHEYIVRTPQCDDSIAQLCDHEVIGAVSSRYISLGHLRGIKVMLGQDYTNGVRNILLFAKPNNDFDYEIYVWGAKQSKYVLKSNE